MNESALSFLSTLGFAGIVAGIVCLLLLLSGRLIGWALGLRDIRANQRKILSELRAINIQLEPDNDQGTIEK